MNDLLTPHFPLVAFTAAQIGSNVVKVEFSGIFGISNEHEFLTLVAGMLVEFMAGSA